MSFSERLQKVMDEKGYTKYKVAKSLHMSATTISNYLKNKTKPDRHHKVRSDESFIGSKSKMAFNR